MSNPIENSVDRFANGQASCDLRENSVTLRGQLAEGREVTMTLNPAGK